jgi:hypothetical protein
MNQQSMLPEIAKPNRRRSEVTMTEFIAACKAAGEMPVPADDPVYTYTERASIPDEFLELAWLEFRERHLENPAKRYRDWRAAFRNSVRDNWFRLWRYADGQCVLTVQGEQAARVHSKAIPQRINAAEALYARNRASPRTYHDERAETIAALTGRSRDHERPEHDSRTIDV